MFYVLNDSKHSSIRSFSQTTSSDEDPDEWRPSEPKTKNLKATRDPASKELKAPRKRTAKSTEPKQPTEPQAPEDPKYPRPSAAHSHAAERKTKTAKVLKNAGELGLPRATKKQNNEGPKKGVAGRNTKKLQTNTPKEEPASTSDPSNKIKQEVRVVAIFITHFSL